MVGRGGRTGGCWSSSSSSASLSTLGGTAAAGGVSSSGDAASGIWLSPSGTVVFISGSELAPLSDEEPSEHPITAATSNTGRKRKIFFGMKTDGQLRITTSMLFLLRKIA